MVAQAPFFVVGAGRSGTTLLRLILTGHSRLHIPPETWFLRLLVREFPLTGALTQPQLERAIDTMVRHDRWPDMGLTASDLRSQATALPQPGLVDLIDLVYRHLLDRSGKQRLGDKTPHYFTIVPELAALYPEAKFLYLVRDGRDVAISWIDAGWERYYEAGFEWPAAMAHLQRDRVAYAGRVLAVHYEDLVQQPAEIAQQICTFLGEVYEPAMLDWQDRTDLVASRDRHLHARLEQPLSENAIAVWRHRLSALECFAMESCLHHELALGSYNLRFAARFWRPLFRLTDRILRGLPHWLKRGILSAQKRGLLPAHFYF